MKNWAEEYENIGHSHEIFTQNLDRTVTNVVQLLMLKAMTISTAESCTGGLLSELITSVPGASQVFELGVCTYSNRIKQTLLNVPEGMLAQYGPVSRQVALAMVRGLKEKSGADLCISVTGLAGPGGGTDAVHADLPFLEGCSLTVLHPCCSLITNLRQYVLCDSECA